MPLGPRAVGWLESDVSEWIAGRVKIVRDGSRLNDAHAWLPTKLQWPGGLENWRDGKGRESQARFCHAFTPLKRSMSVIGCVGEG